MVNVFLSGTVVNSGTAVSTSSGEILADNPKRMAASFYYEGSGTTWLALGDTARTDEGIILTNENPYHINSLNLYTGQVNGITSSTGTVTYVEMATD